MGWRGLIMAMIMVVSVLFFSVRSWTFDCIPTRSFETQDSLEEIVGYQASLIKAYLSGTDAVEVDKLNVILCEYDQQLSQILKARGYEFHQVKLKEEWITAFRNLQIPVHRILPEQRSRVGRLSHDLNTQFEVDLVYSPLLLELFNGKAAFVEQPQRPMLIVTNDSIFNDSVENNSNEHEILHMKFWAYRKGLLPDFLPTAPVHMSYQSDADISPEARVQIYQNFMSFEELITFASNISSIANEFIDSQFASTQKIAELKHEIEKLIAISSNALIAINRAVLLLSEKEPDQLVYPGLLAGQFYELSEKGFSLTIFLEKGVADLCNSKCEIYLKEKLAKAQKLVQFNLAYFNMNSSIDRELVMRAKDFQAEQARFISKL